MLYARGPLLLFLVLSVAAADTSPRSTSVDPRKFSLIRTTPGPAVSGISPAGDLIVTYKGNTPELFDIRKGETTHKLDGHTAGIHAGYFSDNGKIFASSSTDGTVKLWDTGTGKMLHSFKAHAGFC